MNGVGCFAVAMGMLIGACFVLFLWVNSISCHAKWQDSGFQARYGIWSECQIAVQGKWIPSDSYRVVP